MVGDPTPGFWFFCGISVDQQPGAKVDAKDNYVYPPQEQPAKTPWVWQKSLIPTGSQQELSEQKWEKKNDQ